MVSRYSERLCIQISEMPRGSGRFVLGIKPPSAEVGGYGRLNWVRASSTAASDLRAKGTCFGLWGLCFGIRLGISLGIETKVEYLENTTPPDEQYEKGPV